MTMRTSVAVAVALSATGALAACGSGGSDSIDAAVDAPPDADPHTLPHFSFFVTSLKALQALSGNAMGFGGDLRFGESGPGSGLRGADKLCATIAEGSMPGAGGKQWKAFLSVGDGGNGTPIHAIDRIGPGPWYDRVGRMLAPNLASMMAIRPQGGDPAIQNDFPNEDGVTNHRPDLTMDLVDNHDMLTGSDPVGHFAGSDLNCLDWTANAGDEALEGEPQVGHSWPRGPSGQINSWISSLIESGCAPGVSLIEMGPPDPNSNTVGSGGGYGGFYCFALIP
jgi:hypothetical protein